MGAIPGNQDQHVFIRRAQDSMGFSSLSESALKFAGIKFLMGHCVSQLQGRERGNRGTVGRWREEAEERPG